jgi:hypothetical protein
MPEDRSEDSESRWFPGIYRWLEGRRQKKERKERERILSSEYHLSQIRTLNESHESSEEQLKQRISELEAEAASSEGRYRSEAEARNADKAEYEQNLAQKTEKINGLIGKLEAAESRYEKEKARADKLQESLTEKEAEAEKLSEMLADARNDPIRDFGQMLWEGGLDTGIIMVDSENNILRANNVALECLGMQPGDEKDISLRDLVNDNKYFGIYLGFFAEYAEHFHEHGEKFEENTFDLGKGAFTIMGYTSGEDGVYRRGFLCLTPHVPKGAVKKALGALKSFFSSKVSAIHITGTPLNNEFVLDYAVKVMTAKTGKFNVYLEMDMIEEASLGSVVKSYILAQSTGTELKFLNVPQDVADYLVEKGVPEEIIEIGGQSKSIATEREIRDYLDFRKSVEEGEIPGNSLAEPAD